MNKIRLLVSFFLLVAFSLGLSAQTELPMSLGAYAGLNFNMHTPQFTLDKNTRVFDQNKTTVGANLGAIGNYPINDNFIFTGRIGYNGLGGTLDSKMADTTLEGNLHYIEIMPAIIFSKLIPVKNLYLLGGLEFGIPVSNNYTINRINKELPDNSFRMALAAGFGYSAKIGKGAYLIPELSFRLPLTDVSSNSQFKSWNVPQLRIGISLCFSLKDDEKPVERDDKNFLDVGFAEVKYYDDDGISYPLKKIKTEDIQYTELFPLVPYVFFEESKSQPNGKFQILQQEGKTGEFDMAQLAPDAIAINSRTLDIIGTRMNLQANSEMTITGTNDNKIEKTDAELAGKRAEFTKNYLISTYKIKPDRIKTIATGLPAKPSAVTIPDGIKENRRIELSSVDKRLLEPILIEKERQSIATPNLIEFVPKIDCSDSITSWHLEIYQGSKKIRDFFGTGKPASVKFNVLPDELSAGNIPLDYSIKATSINGLSKSTGGSVPVEHFSFTRKKTEDLPDKTISKFSLILFDFDKADISQPDKETIDKYIISAIKYNSIVHIYGYTDRSGDEGYNKKLAERRCLAVKEYIYSKIKPQQFELHGVGESEMIFDNENPVGRQLSRTVQVFIITPKELK